MSPPSPCNLKLRMVFAVIGFFVGVSVFLSFGFIYKNWDTACFGLVSGLVALATLLCHIQYHHDGWKRAPDLLSPLMLSGCFIQLLGVLAFAVYLALAINQHQSEYFIWH
ncbi:hypothetical protein CAPTEDRAFT_194611 [Capitella teleta]|uniref:Uncharacterized protein n=1 Tax=Capitella teleta TaxID=283909 RepID=R7VBC6_CAPTE|nr:hypothetical protein CAPTEDRAFT_194611 [Capitella teleta]|eukprot:ELU15929.1 hypothetical protein CAPTEDRAFT_194611 [Capitella teleta]